MNLERYWNDIPIGRENALQYDELESLWNACNRQVRNILHDLSIYDNGDDYVLIRSSSGRGFYKTDDVKTLEAFKKECLNKGKSIFAPIKKINRILNSNMDQLHFENNLRVVRESKNLTQSKVCEMMKTLDKSMLSKMENGVCLPTPAQLLKLAEIYDVANTTDLINVEFC